MTELETINFIGWMCAAIGWTCFAAALWFFLPLRKKHRKLCEGVMDEAAEIFDRSFVSPDVSSIATGKIPVNV